MTERPRVECLFPQFGREKTPTPVPVPPRERSRCSGSEPLIASSFRRATSCKGRAQDPGVLPTVAESELSVATTAFVAASCLGAESKVAAGSKAAPEAPRELDALDSAVAQADAKAAEQKTQNAFQACPYHTTPESSIVSDWRYHYWHVVGKGCAIQRGLRAQDIRYGNQNSAGVCVLRQQDDVPKIGTHSGAYLAKQHMIKKLNEQLVQLNSELGSAVSKKPGASRMQSQAGRSRSSSGVGMRAPSGTSARQVTCNFTSLTQEVRRSSTGLGKRATSQA